jgi:ABC-2 type transport system ATP-binding protein
MESSVARPSPRLRRWAPSPVAPPPGTDHVIEARALSRHFGPTVAVDGLSLSVRRGEVFGLLGHNGAGKTTMIRLVNGLLRPTSGDIWTFGLPTYVNGAEIRARTGVVTESTALDDFLTIRETLVAYGRMAGMRGRRVEGRAAELLELFGLRDVADLQARQVSAGMRQRAAFARGLIHEPDLLLLDEPTANLDPVAAMQVRDLVTRLARTSGCTVVLSTHNLREAEDVCDRIAVLRSGTLQALGTMDELGQLVGAGGRPVTIHVEPGDASAALEVASEFGRARSGERPDIVRLDRAAVGSVPRLVAGLVARDVRVRGVVQEAPTLEDVYLALHSERGGS